MLLYLSPICVSDKRICKNLGVDIGPFGEREGYKKKAWQKNKDKEARHGCKHSDFSD